MIHSKMVLKHSAAGRLAASQSCIYQILNVNDFSKFSKSRTAFRRSKPKPFLATSPREVWIWAVHETKCNQLAADLMKQICAHLQIKDISLHADNGGPTTGATMLAKLHHFGVIPSFSRPAYPNYFHPLDIAREWGTGFAVLHYNSPLHSGMKIMTPKHRRRGIDKLIHTKNIKPTKQQSSDTRRASLEKSETGNQRLS